MQIQFNTIFYRSNIYCNKTENYNQNRFVNSPIRSEYKYNTSFGSSIPTQTTISTKIIQEKNKLLRHLKEILSTNIQEKTEKDLLLEMIAYAHSTLSKMMTKHDKIFSEIDLISNSKTLKPKQKLDSLNKLKGDLNALLKLDPFKLPKTETKPASENYDYVLINKFKNAILNNNFDLDSIYTEHYSDLSEISTIEELKDKYPTIRIPQDPMIVLAKKCTDILDRSFYEDLDDLYAKSEASEDIADFFSIRLSNMLANLAKTLNLNSDILLPRIVPILTNRILDIYDKTKSIGFNFIPQTRKQKAPAITANDIILSKIDYNKYVLSILKEQYLDKKKPNDIKYEENGIKISLSEIKDPEYRFEKLSEKIKKLINDSNKIRFAQRDYQKFTNEELRERLNYYTKTELGNNEEILEIIINFDSCKFTEEDRQYLIKFLQILDNISDQKINLQNGVQQIKENNIRPHGTVRLNEIERKAIEEKIKIQQQEAFALNKLREEFNTAINKLYEKDLGAVAESFNSFYPESYDENTVKSTTNAIKIINESLKLKDTHKTKNELLRWQIYNEYSNNPTDPVLFQEARNYGSTFSSKEAEQRAGQYLLNRELLDNYPACLKILPNPEIIERIHDKFAYDKNLATIYLCKFEDYKMMSELEQKSILNILKIFDYKNANDRIVLKSIIETDYINNNTSLPDNSVTITSDAKKAILDKYRFPGCLDLFTSFEEAMSSSAGKSGMAGIKKTDSVNKAVTHKMELKIMGYPDRLFSSQNNYIFDIYSEKGFH